MNCRSNDGSSNTARSASELIQSVMSLIVAASNDANIGSAPSGSFATPAAAHASANGAPCE